MSKTQIEWSGHVWNPMVGCTKKSAGCDHCYAMGDSPHRFADKYDRDGVVKLNSNPKRPGLTFVPRKPSVIGQGPGKPLGKGAQWTGEVRLLPWTLDVPLRRRKPTVWFVNSLSDLFHEAVVGCEEGRRFIAAIFGVIAATPQHTYQILTKRPDKAREWFAWLDERVAVRVARSTMSHFERIREVSEQALRSVPRPTTSRGCKRLDPIARVSHGSYHWFPESARMGVWPLPNVWIGTSVEDQAAADQRIPELLSVPAAVRFLSCEPLLGPVDLDDSHAWLTPLVGTDGPRCDWVIVGGESGPKARPCDVAWIRSLVEQCKAAGVPCFVKQLGSRPVGATGETTAWGEMTLSETKPIELKSRKGADPNEWPEDLRVREMPETE